MTTYPYTINDVALFLRDEWSSLEGNFYNSTEVEWVKFFVAEYEKYRKESEK